ncbi:hypothetical protein [Brevibacterium samyangense]|uniref:Uncharacterized protein n=1 Tax=Brevibacterium samyangense TaxID=366888 RepID=A0ABP5ES39_9MICO
MIVDVLTSGLTSGLAAGGGLTGRVLPESVLHSEWFATLAAFVALNTVVYLCLALCKIFPVPRPAYRGRSRRAETRSIHPDAPEPGVGPGGRGASAVGSSTEVR